MGLCISLSPLIVVVAVLGHATSWFGLGAPTGASTNGVVAGVGDLLSGAGSLVSQLFAWMVVLLGLQLICSIFSFIVGEIKLRRLYDRAGRRNRWARPGASIPAHRPTADSRPPL
ncbi:MAG: hypothetical protein M3Z25_01490 [Actinomycetota bacterium]|nr:hypothetical protein [Actinomycetota bacterium]